MSDGRVSIEEIKQAIASTAYYIRRHNMPELLPALDRDGDKLAGGRHEISER